MGKRSSDKEITAGNNLLALGMTFAAGIVFFSLLGLAVDKWLGLTPLFTLVGTLGGATLSFLNVYWKLTAAEDRDRKRNRP